MMQDLEVSAEWCKRMGDKMTVFVDQLKKDFVNVQNETASDFEKARFAHDLFMNMGLLANVDVLTK